MSFCEAKLIQKIERLLPEVLSPAEWRPLPAVRTNVELRLDWREFDALKDEHLGAALANAEKSGRVQSRKVRPDHGRLADSKGKHEFLLVGVAAT